MAYSTLADKHKGPLNTTFGLQREPLKKESPNERITVHELGLEAHTPNFVSESKHQSKKFKQSVTFDLRGSMKGGKLLEESNGSVETDITSHKGYSRH
jgi:hypothetical protein